MIYIIDKLKIISTKSNLKIECQIVPISKDLVPKKKDGWSFNWLKTYREKPNTIFVLIEKRSNKIHGVIQLAKDGGMLIMELIELSPFQYWIPKRI